MINTVLQTIEKYESFMGLDRSPDLDLSADLETSILPTTAFEQNESDDTSVHIDEDDTSDDSDDCKDILGPTDGEKMAFPSDPLHIRQTLKDKIRIRRESEGARELIDLFEPPIQYTLTEEEELKNEQRKQRNRRSANKSRLKRIAYEKKLEQDANDLEKEHAQLKREVEELRKQKLFYCIIFKQHSPSCQRMAEAIKQYLTQQKVALPTSNSSTLQVKYNQNELLGSNITSNQESQLPQFIQQPPRPHLTTKRKNADEVSSYSIKVPKLCSSSLHSNLNHPLGVESTRTALKSDFSNNLSMNAAALSQDKTSNLNKSVSFATNIASHDNTLLEIPINSAINQSHIFRANHNHAPHLCSSVFSNTDGMVTDKDDLKTFETEEQRINYIKEHLLDGYQMSPAR